MALLYTDVHALQRMDKGVVAWVLAFAVPKHPSSRLSLQQ
jgi:hypothetical protein